MTYVLDDMAVERQHVIKDTHLRNITTLGYNPSRREILSGYEGILKLIYNLLSNIMYNVQYII